MSYLRIALPVFLLIAMSCSSGAGPKHEVVSFTVPPQQAGGIPAASLPARLAVVPDCAVTTPTGGVPPGESRFSPNVFTENGIWVGMWPQGTVVFEAGGPGSVEPDGALGMKFWWWRPSTEPLSIEGRRLDAPAPPLYASIDNYPNQQFQPVGIAFPTQGCWEVTGRVGNSSLTFVTLVIVVP